MTTREDVILYALVRKLHARHIARQRTFPYSGFGWRFKVAYRYIKRYYQTPAAFERVMAEGYVEGFDDVSRAADMSQEAATHQCVSCGKRGMLYRPYINRALKTRKEFFECAHCGAVEEIK